MQLGLGSLRTTAVNIKLASPRDNGLSDRVNSPTSYRLVVGFRHGDLNRLACIIYGN